MGIIRRWPTASSVDVLLLVEGTYPVLPGGVSEWVHATVSALEGRRFGIVFIGGDRAEANQLHYSLPQNVVHFEHHFIADSWKARRHWRGRPQARNPGALSQLASFYHALVDAATNDLEPPPADELFELIAAGSITREDFLHSREAWDVLRVCYQGDGATGARSFIDIFWQIRAMYAPLLTLNAIIERLPDSQVVHALSTGFAGALATLLKQRRGDAILLSEHGVYTRERTIDLARTTGGQKGPGRHSASLDDSDGRRVWIKYFESLGRISYRHADRITALHKSNQEWQLAAGAPPARSRIVANGIDVSRFACLRDDRTEEIPRVVAFIGRVVAIKDVKTFIRSIALMRQSDPDIVGWIVGPVDQDPRYADECLALIRSLGQLNHVRFLGYQDVEGIYPRAGLVMLTSLSESLPLVVLEAFAAGVPVVATDVGACAELIRGRDEKDRRHGSAGAIVSIANPQQTCDAALALLNDHTAWRAARDAGSARVKALYDENSMLAEYEALYAHISSRAA
ncbi:MAG: GT4 family glycosyltransferase PelF [Pseudomonadota bacterium]